MNRKAVLPMAALLDWRDERRKKSVMREEKDEEQRINSARIFSGQEKEERRTAPRQNSLWKEGLIKRRGTCLLCC